MSPEVRPVQASQFPRSHLAEAIAKAKGGGGGGGGGSGTGRGLVGQVIPIYGFGILLYILYILFKVRFIFTLKIILVSRKYVSNCGYLRPLYRNLYGKDNIYFYPVENYRRIVEEMAEQPKDTFHQLLLLQSLWDLIGAI